MTSNEKENECENNEEISNIVHDTNQDNRTTQVLRIIVFLISCAISITVVILIGFLQYHQYENIINNKTSGIGKKSFICRAIDTDNINVISSIAAALLILLYIFIYKRRVFLVDKFKYKNIGLPAIISCWNKSDRLYTSLTYGVIAFNIYGIINTTIGFKGGDQEETANNTIGSEGLNKTVITNINALYILNKLGLASLFYRILKVLLIGISKF